MWARKYSACIECGTTERKHYGNGLCYQCYNRGAYRANPESQKRRSRLYYEDHHDEKLEYQSRYYQLNREEQLAWGAIYREEKHFSGKRKDALQRDGFRCTVCGSDSDLVVHHIDWNGRGKLKPNNDLGNLTTVCRACHVRIHLPRLGTGKG